MRISWSLPVLALSASLACFVGGSDEETTTVGDEIDGAGTESETETDTESETETETGPECTQDIHCDDDDACTEDLCDAGSCVHSDISATCDDQDECTIDSCDPARGCTTAPIVQPGMQVFAVTNLVESFVVPACTTTIHIDARGAQGGTVDGGNVDWQDTNCRKGLDASAGPDGIAGNGPLSAPGGAAGNGGSGTAPSGVGAGGAGWKSNGGDSSFGSPATGGQAPPSFMGGLGGPSFTPGGEGGFGGGGGAVCGCGGGGGYSGGGGGEGQSCRAGGGGGGSFNAGTNPMSATGVGLGNGEVIISWAG